MKTLIALSAALALAACGNRADTTADTTAGAAPTATATGMAEAPSPAANQPATGSMAGTYEMTSADGTRTTQTIKPDGTFTQIANGEETTGTWRMDGARSCFDPAGAAAEVCYTTTAPGADGSFTATGPDGAAMTVRKTAAAPMM